MQKLQLADKIQSMLEENDYSTCRYHGCFDIAAKKDNLLFLKVLQNVDSFMEQSSRSLKIISQNLDASALLIGERTNAERLKNGIVYERFEIPTVSIETFFQIITEKIFPRIYRDRGGLYVEIDSEGLRAARERKNLSQRQLADAVGISKKAIYQHESNQLRMILKIAEKIEKVVGKKIIKETNPLEKGFAVRSESPSTILEKSISSELKRKGFSVSHVRSAPFDIFARAGTLIVSGIEENKRKLQRHAPTLEKFVSLVHKPGVAITENISDADVEIPVVKRKELKEMEAKDLIRIAKRKKN